MDPYILALMQDGLEEVLAQDSADGYGFTQVNGSNGM